MKYILPVGLNNEFLKTKIKNNEYILFFEKSKDLNTFVKKTNSLLIKTKIVNQEEINKIIKFYINYKYAIVTECSEEEFTVEYLLVPSQ